MLNVTSTMSASTSTSITEAAATAISTATSISAKPSRTEISERNSTKISLSRASMSGLVAAIIIAIIVILILSFAIIRRRKGLSLLDFFRRFRRNDPPATVTISETNLDLLPPYTPANDLSNPAERTATAPEIKSRPLQIDEQHRRVGELRTELGQHGSSSGITNQLSESAARGRGVVADDTPDPRIMKQIIALRAQIHHWEEQLTSSSPSHLTSAQSNPENHHA